MMPTRRRLLALAAFAGTLPALPGAALSRAIGRSADVTRFGARGTGRGDDAPAIQAAIDSGVPVVRFPAGHYPIGRPLTPRPGQVWLGDGMQVTRLFLPEIDKAPYSIVHTRESLEHVAFSGIAFHGNRDWQKRRSQDGQAPFGLYLRGGCTDVSIDDCLFQDLGNSSVPANRTGGGGIVLGPVPGAPDQTVENIAIRRCIFRGNGNVPGLYIGAGDRPGFRRRNIAVIDNEFEGVPHGTRAQNCIYILSESPAAEIVNVTVAHNRFHVEAMVDALIEMNWVRGFSITGNTGIFDAALRDTSAVLLRDGVTDGAVTANSFVNRSGNERVSGIVLVNFVDPWELGGIAISGNALRGFSRAAILVDRGSRNVVVQGNRIDGPGGAGIRIAASANVLVSGNLLTGLDAAIQLAARTAGPPTQGIQITQNRISDSGRQDSCLIEMDGGSAIDVRDLVIAGNIVSAPRPGTRALATGRFAQADGNRMERNLTGGLPAVPADERGGYERIAEDNG